jgi:hypothetical protein
VLIGAFPAPEQLIAQTELIEDFPDRVIDDLLHGLRFGVHPGDRREDHGALALEREQRLDERFRRRRRSRVATANDAEPALHHHVLDVQL